MPQLSAAWLTSHILCSPKLGTMSTACRPYDWADGFSVHRVQGCCTVRTSSFDLSDLDAATGPSGPSCIGHRSPSNKQSAAAQPAADGPARQSSGAGRSSKRANSLRAIEHKSGGAAPTWPEPRASMELTEQHQSRDVLLPAHQSSSTDAVLVPGG